MYRRPVIEGAVDQRLKVIGQVCAEQHSPVVVLETTPDRVHLLTVCGPQYGIHPVVRTIKARTSGLL
jgi:putative transposase